MFSHHFQLLFSDADTTLHKSIYMAEKADESREGVSVPVISLIPQRLILSHPALDVFKPWLKIVDLVELQQGLQMYP